MLTTSLKTSWMGLLRLPWSHNNTKHTGDKMIKLISATDCQAVFGYDECTYQPVLDDFQNTEFIGIMTYNISSKSDSDLLQSLKDACKRGADTVLITNIPKRFSQYYRTNGKNYYAEAAKRVIDTYLQQLNPVDYNLRLHPYFSFDNHAKIIMTDNMVYWGSGNFSDESNSNFECGTISTDPSLIEYLKCKLFPNIQSESIPYYSHNFAVAIVNLEDLIMKCTSAKQALHEAAFEAVEDYDTNFEVIWVYRTTDSGVTTEFLDKFIYSFSQFDDALKIIECIIDGYQDCEELPQDVATLEILLDEYKCTYKNFYDTISSLFEDLDELANFDVSADACHRITDKYGMVAYDENFDYYVDKAMNEAQERYEKIIDKCKRTVLSSLNTLDEMVIYFENLKTNLFQLLEVNTQIDNTGL